MTTTDFTDPRAYAAPQPAAMGAGADIFRRLDRPQSKSKWLAAAPAAVLAVFAIGGVLAYETMSGPSPAPRPFHALTVVPAPAAPLPTAAPLAAEPATPVVPAAAPVARTQAPSPISHRRHEAPRVARQAAVSEDVAPTAAAPAATPIVSAPPPASPTAVAPSEPVIAPSSASPPQ